MARLAGLRWTFLACCAAALLCNITAYAATSPIKLVTTDLALSVWDTDPTITTGIVKIQNQGTATADNVTVTSVVVSGGTRVEPSSLPVVLGMIASGEDARLTFKLKLPATTGTRYLLTLSGYYIVGAQTQGFSLNRYISPTQPSTGPFLVSSGLSAKVNPVTAFYPPPPPRVTEFNADTEAMLIPPGPFRRLIAPTPTPTAPSGLSGSAPVRIVNNTGQNRSDNSIPPDPSAAASGGGVVLTTVNNALIRYSLNGGASFTSVDVTKPQPGNPSRKSLFPEDDGGACCDQVVIYVPARDLFIWLIQYDPVCGGITACGPTNNTITAASRLRIAFATPAAIAADFWNAWTYFDLTATALGTTATEWVDYPDLAFSDTYLYVSVDHGTSTYGGIFGSRFAVRANLADIVDPNTSTVGYQVTEFAVAGKRGSTWGINKSHFVQGAPQRMILAGLKDTSTMFIETWRDNDAAPTAQIVPISSMSANDKDPPKFSSTAPDNSDWVGVGIPGMVSGATYRSVFTFIGEPNREEYLIAFTGGSDAARGRPNPYVRLVTLELDRFFIFGTEFDFGVSLYDEYEIWNSAHAYNMASLATQGEEVGIGVAAGGGSFGFPQYCVGYKDDFVVYVVTSSDATQGIRFGDYFDVRPIPGTGDFATLGYDVVLSPTGNWTCPGGTCQANPRYVRFGRTPSLPPK